PGPPCPSRPTGCPTSTPPAGGATSAWPRSGPPSTSRAPPTPGSGAPCPPPVPFSAYGVPNIDATGWVADVGMASVWTTKHVESAPDPRVSRRLPAPDRDAYFLMSAPGADLLGDIDVFAMRAQWALAAGQPLSTALRTYYLGRPGRPPGIRWPGRAFASVNRLAYGRDGARIVWDPAWWTGWVRRIDRFNDVYG